MGGHSVGADGSAGASDAELALLAAGGDQAALGAIFDRYAPRLLAFCTSMLRRRADAEDCLQDVFVIAATRLTGLREPERLRSWLFSVARHECLGRIEKGGREVPVDTIPDTPSAEPDHPADHVLDAELAEVLAAAVAGLPERDRLALELADRQGLPTDEVAAVLGMSPPSAYKVLTRARAGARRSLGALLVARTGRGDCPELALLLADWHGPLTPLLRKRVARHIDGCEICAERQRRVATPAALLGSGPAFAVPITLRSKILVAAHDARSAPATHATGGTPARHEAGGTPATHSADRTPAALAADRDWHRGWPKGSGPVRRRRTPGFVAALVLALLALGTVLVVRGHDSSPVAGRGTAPSTAGAAATPTSVAGTHHAAPAPPPTRVGLESTRAATRTSTPSAPTIDSVSVQCVYRKTAAAYVPVLSWQTSHDTGVAVSVDNPGVVGSYGRYGPDGTTDLPPAGCAPGAGPQTYTVTTVGGTGPAASRTIDWTPPTRLSSSATATSAAATSSSSGSSTSATSDDTTPATTSPAASDSTTTPVIQ